MSTSGPEGESITAEGLVALKSELFALESVGRRDIAKRILTAREHGDLKENAEYHAAKEDQSHLETRIKRLRQRLRNAVVVTTETETVASRFDFARTAEVHPGAALGTSRIAAGPYSRATVGNRRHRKR